MDVNERVKKKGPGNYNLYHFYMSVKKLTFNRTMRNKWTLLAILVILIQPCFMYSAGVLAPNHMSGDTLYSWADGGLNIRTSGSTNADIVGSIPYGSYMLFLEFGNQADVEQVQFYKASTKDSLVYGSEFKCIDYFQKGLWMKVQFGRITGYVFSGYTSRFVPIQDDNWIPDWIKQNEKLISEKQINCQEPVCVDKFMYFENGISVVGKLSKAGDWTYLIPFMTLEEAMLLTRKQIESRMKDIHPNGLGCLNETFGNQDAGIVSYRITNYANWSMTITWTFNAVIISESFWC